MVLVFRFIIKWVLSTDVLILYKKQLTHYEGVRQIG
jgi:hypothetical protein